MDDDGYRPVAEFEGDEYRPQIQKQMLHIKNALFILWMNCLIDLDSRLKFDH